MLTYTTAGESHGRCLLTTIHGLPYGTPVDPDAINAELTRRQGGYGRGARMKLERDRAEVITGARKGHTLGSPLTLQIMNRVQNTEQLGEITKPRPGHADLPGAIKYGSTDAREIAERSSARETAARVAAGAVAETFLKHFDIEVLAYVVEIAGIGSDVRCDDPAELVKRRDASIFYSLDDSLDGRIKEKVDEVRKAGDTLGGIFEVLVLNAPAGLGGHIQWGGKLDGLLARALMSVQTVKAVEVGLGIESARRAGSEMHDEIVHDGAGKLGRTRNNAGGIEGGMTNGQPVILRAACKPISTLRKPLRTVDLKTKEAVTAQYERSDVCVIPAASVIGQAVVALEIAGAFLEKFGGDSFDETRRRYEAFREGVKKYDR